MPSCNWAFGCAIGLFVITLVIVLIILLGGSDDNKEKIIVMPVPSGTSSASSKLATATNKARQSEMVAAPSSSSCGSRAAARVDIQELHSAQDAVKLLKASKPALILFYADFCGHCKQMMPDFEQAAKEASSKTGIIIAKVESGKLKDMASVSSQLPAINGFPTMCTNYEGNGIQAHVGRKDRAAIEALIQKAAASSRMAARAAMPSHGARQMMEFGSMQEACAALKGKKKAIVMAYADWCGFCKAMKADYESLVDKAPAGIIVGRLNSNAIKAGEKCEGVEEIKAFPTILYNNGSKITKVMGRQSLQALLDLLKK